MEETLDIYFPKITTQNVLLNITIPIIFLGTDIPTTENYLLKIH